MKEQHSQRTLSLLGTKVGYPGQRMQVIERPQLTEILSRYQHCTLLLLTAPAGFGKTTFVSHWLAPKEHLVGWLSLDEHDNDLHRFLDYVLYALDRIQPGFAAPLSELLHAPGAPPMEVYLSHLVDHLAHLPDGFVLVLDDYHIIHDPLINEAIQVLVDNWPIHGHVAITSRTEPSLPLARWQARGQLVCLEIDDLRFSEFETQQFFRDIMQVSLSTEQSARLTAYTEGWVAGLQLAGLSLQRSPHIDTFLEQFHHNTALIEVYLLEEVLSLQSTEMQDVLGDIAILERFCAPLCDAVRGSKNSEAMLQELWQSRLFVVPLDQEKVWYRFHHLFAELLLRRAERARPEQIKVLHLRACEWLAAQGHTEEAIDHALKAGDQARAAALVLTYGPTLQERFETRRLLELIQRLPQRYQRELPQLGLLALWCLHGEGRWEPGAQLTLEQIKADLKATQAQIPPDDQDQQSRNADLFAQAWFIEARILSVQECRAEALEIYQEVLTALSPERVFLRSLTAFHLVLDRRQLAKENNILPALDQELAGLLQQLQDTPQGLTLSSYTAWTQAFYAHENGEGRLAMRRFQEAAEDLEQRGAFDIAPGALVPIYTSIAHLHLEWCEPEAAAPYITQSRSLLHAGIDWNFLEYFYVIAAVWKHGQGDTQGAHEDIAMAWKVHHDDAPSQHSIVSMAEVGLWLAEGEFEKAIHWSEAIGFSAEDEIRNSTKLGHMIFIHVLLLQQRIQEASTLLARLKEFLVRTKERRSLIDALIMEALIEQLQGRPDDAIAPLVEALALAAPGNYLRPFVDMALFLDPLYTALRTTPERLRPVGSVDFLERLYQKLPGHTIDFSGLQSNPLDKANPALPGVEKEAAQPPEPETKLPALSPREQELLQLVADGMANKEIALHLHISTETVKKHLQNVYHKLGVRNRTKAVAEARKQGQI